MEGINEKDFEEKFWTPEIMQMAEGRDGMSNIEKLDAGMQESMNFFNEKMKSKLVN